MLVSAKEMLNKAKAGHYAVGQFNINNLEWTKSILLAAEETRSPVILGVSEGAGKYMTGYKTVVGMVNGMLEELNISVPVALHLDHGSYEGCYKCIEAGFSSIMFDGSHYPIEENIEKTKELVKVAKGKGMSIEAEVGSIGGEEDGVIGRGECADPRRMQSSCRSWSNNACSRNRKHPRKIPRKLGRIKLRNIRCNSAVNRRYAISITWWYRNS